MICRALLTMALALLLIAPVQAETLRDFLEQAQPAELVPGADRVGAAEGMPPVAPVYQGADLVGHAYLNTDVGPAVGYSGKPIHMLVGLSPDGVVTGAKLVGHSEPIVLIGIPEFKMTAFLDQLVGFDAAKGLEAVGDMDVDIISGATVTVLVMQDSVTRSAIKVARSLGLGGLSQADAALPTREIDRDVMEIKDWRTLHGEGSVRRLTLSVADVNSAFERSGNPEAAARPEEGPSSDAFMDLYVAQVSVPSIGRSLLGEDEYANLVERLDPGQSAILVAGSGRYSFKGSGYVRGGIFDRVQLIQDVEQARFHDYHHKRLRDVAPQDAPDFKEVALFEVPADMDFHPAAPWRLELLVQRATGPLEKAFVTFQLDYAVPEPYLTAPPPAPEPTQAEAGAAEEPALWKRIWAGKPAAIGGVAFGIVTLTGIFFFQNQLTRRPKVLTWVRYAFLTYTLVWLGWYMNAQLSVVNTLTFFNSLISDFSWTYFLMDPLIFILWFATAASLLFWGRGPFCGWLCPFGALQEITNHIGRRLGIKQVTIPFAVHERLWPIKYMIFLGLFGLSLYDLALAETLSEVEPFKTAIILNFARDWPFVVYALTLLAAGLVVERFFCRYLCPLGAALAIPGKLRMFEWLKRWPECGSQCGRCARECPVQSIHPEGHIDVNECIYCMHCQELYFDDHRCPHNVTRRLKKERRRGKGTAAKPTGAGVTAPEPPQEMSSEDSR